MIVQNTFIVTGKATIDDDILFCRNLLFAVVGESRLVIVPKKGAAPGAQRVLKIVADNIDTGSGGAEITYNLDGNIMIPLTEIGLDPETPSKNGNNGSPDFDQGILGPRATPNFILGLPQGSFPTAQNGGEGSPGGKGGTGRTGENGPILEIWVKNISGSGLQIDLRGQQGGDGGKGGNGQVAGDGQMGSNAVAGTPSVDWLGVKSTPCVQQPGRPGDGGRGGDAGCGGDGGDGGNGGYVKVFYTSSAAPNLSLFTYALQGGKGGSVGVAGKPGPGGASGPAGINVLACKTDGVAQPGATGRPCPQEKGPTRNGKDGKDGTQSLYPVTDIPHIPALWP